MVIAAATWLGIMRRKGSGQQVYTVKGSGMLRSGEGVYLHAAALECEQLQQRG